jgi:hypothetical protein
VKNIIAAVIAVLALSACSSPGGGTAMTPAVTNTQVAGTTPHVQPNDRRGTDPIIYVVDSHAQTVNMYDYPSLELVGKLTDVPFPTTVCIAENYANANVWVGGYDSNKNPELIEYAHGSTTPITTLADNGPEVKACAPINNGRILSADSDPIDGKPSLNVSDWFMRKPSQPPVKYTDIPNMQALTGIGRTASGAAFVSGYDAAGDYILDKFLPYEFRTFTQLAVSIPIDFPGPVYTIGPKLFISDKSDNNDQAVIYQINPATGALMATTTLANSTDCEAYAVAKIKQQGQQMVFCPDVNTGSVDIYNFPEGGQSIGKITGLQYPVAVAVSRIPPPSPAPSPSP